MERPCRRSGCKGTWLDKRGGQLARAVRGKTGDPYPQYCENCAKEIGDLEDRQVPCKTDNCTGTWTWAKAAQLAAGVRPEMKQESSHAPGNGSNGAKGAPAEGVGPDAVASAEQGASAAAGAREQRPSAEAPASQVMAAPGAKPAGKHGRRRKRRREVRPPERRCQTCLDFLTDRKTMEIACKQCGTPIYWPPESQLQTHLGAWAEPSLCGACKRDVTEAMRAAQREALRHPGGVVPAPQAAEETAAAESTEATLDAERGGGRAGRACRTTEAPSQPPTS